MLVDDEENARICRSNIAVNIARISPTEYLFTSNNIYHYDAETRCFTLVKVKSAEHLALSSGLSHIASTQSESYFFGSNRIIRVDHTDKTFSPVYAHPPRLGTLNAVVLTADTFRLGTTTGLYALKLGSSPVKISTPLFSEVSSLLADRSGRLLLASHGMLFTLSPDGHFTALDEADGVTPNEFLPKPVLVGPSGDSFLGGVSGLVRVKAEAPAVSYGGDPAVTLVEVAVGGKTVEPQTVDGMPMLRLPHNYSSLALRIAAYKDEVFRRKLFRYYIEGGNETPVQTSDNLIKLHNLAPGDYTLMAQSALPDGTWNAACPVLRIRVSEPWWAHPLTRSLVVLLLFVAIGAGIQIVFRRKELRLARAMEEHDRRVQEEKVRFLISINHELRTPLTLIHAPLKQLIDKTPLPLDAKRQLQRIHKQTKYMCNTVNMVLDLRRIETVDNPLHTSLTEVNDWVRSVAADFEYEVADHPDRLRLNLSEGLPTLTFDSNRCESVLATMLINAFRLCAPETSITVSTERLGDFVRIAVSNTDRSLTDDDVELLFKRFYLGTTTDRRSAGIGLAYAKVLIEMHGGRVGAFNNEGAPGSTVYFDLPVAESVVKEAAPVGSLLAAAEPDEALPAVDSVEAESIAAPVYTLLIAESDADMRGFLVEVLADKFGSVLEADNGVDALMLVRQEVPDVVIASAALARESGLHLCRQIKQTPELAHIPVVLLTGKTDPDDMLRCYKAGADIHLAKPFEPAILEARVSNLLKNSASMKERYKKFDVAPDLAPQEAMRGADEQFVVRLNRVIQDNLSSTELDVAFIAKALGMSRATLYGKTKSLIGIGVGDYVARRRLEAACVLLEQTALPIQEVSARCGFSNQRYFSTVFKNAKGMTPSAWREEQRSTVTVKP